MSDVLCTKTMISSTQKLSHKHRAMGLHGHFSHKQESPTGEWIHGNVKGTDQVMFIEEEGPDDINICSLG